MIQRNLKEFISDEEAALSTANRFTNSNNALNAENLVDSFSSLTFTNQTKTKSSKKDQFASVHNQFPEFPLDEFENSQTENLFDSKVPLHSNQDFMIKFLITLFLKIVFNTDKLNKILLSFFIYQYLFILYRNF